MAYHYSEDFKSRCKIAYPKARELHRALDHNSEAVGRILSELNSSTITPDTILRATSLAKLKELAKREKMRAGLYTEWYDTYLMAGHKLELMA